MSLRWGRWLPLVIGLIAALAPGTSVQLLSGVPLSPASIIFAALVAYAAVALGSLEWQVTRWLSAGLLAVAVLKAIAAAVAPPLGLTASYWAAGTADGPSERSTDFPWLADSTRIDPQLDLRGEEFPVHFFNDASRFNFGPDVQPGRDQLPFFVRWQGWLIVPSDGSRQFVVEASGPSHVWLDDHQLPDLESDVDLNSGLHALRAEYARPEAKVPRFSLRWQREPGGPMVPIGGRDVQYRQQESQTAALSALLGMAADALAALTLVAWLVLGFRGVLRTHHFARAALGAVPVLFLVHGMLLHAPLIGHATILSGLDDWLVYESSARDILLNGWLMAGGQGHAAPFYGQPLYPYVLALVHRLTGESLFGPLAVQFAALGVVVAGAAVLARKGFGTPLDGLVALACLWLLLQLEPEHFKVARQLFNENLYMPLIMASLIATVVAARRPTAIKLLPAVGLGALYGVTAISRSQFLLFVPFGLLILLVAWRRCWPTALASLVAAIAGLILTIAPITARNFMVSGQFLPITSSGGASLLEFHRPPAGLIDPAALQKDPLFDLLHLDTQTRTVLAFIRADPRGYVNTLLPLGAHSVGLQGRNDASISWPLFATTLLYLASFCLARVRQLHVWPIHAFVATHLVVLILFEADTYGYRLVMPMYAPMVTVAAQVPLPLMRAVMGSRLGASMRSGDLRRATRVAAIGWATLAVVALLLQVRGLAELWSIREPALHGLGGPAAQAALTSDAVNADAIYVASIDGTPRRFGAGSLTGLRYPWFKWFDPVRSVPMPSTSSTAVYMLSELQGQSVANDLVGCLGSPDAHGQVVGSGAEIGQRCAGDLASATPISFDGLARVDGVRTADKGEAGQPVEARLLWQPLVPHPQPQQVSLQLDDPAAGDGIQWGNGTLELYPAAEWQVDETIVSRVPIQTDPTALPQRYRLTIGMSPLKPNSPPATAMWQGAVTDRVPVGTVTLSPGTIRADQPLPAEMRPLDGQGLDAGGLKLIGVRPLPSEAASGSPLKIGLLWQATQDAPEAAQATLRLMRSNGDVVQQSTIPLLGGRIAPSALRAGNVVRDEQQLVIGPAVPAESVTVELSMGDGLARLGTLKITGRAHRFDPTLSASASFGNAIELVGSRLDPQPAHPGDKVTVNLRWRAAAEMQQAYKVFVHVLDPTGQQVLAQRDAEPVDGKAPTTSWVQGEVLDDAYVVTLPASLSPGQFPVELGVYNPRSGDRLTLADGQNRVVLPTALTVR